MILQPDNDGITTATDKTLVSEEDHDNRHWVRPHGRSYVWKGGKKCGSRAKCDLCDRQYVHCGGTGALDRHFKKKHKKWYKANRDSVTGDEVNQPSPQTPDEDLDTVLAKVIIHDFRPISLVEGQ